MSNNLIESIVSSDDSLRNRSINSLLLGKSSDELRKAAAELEEFRKLSDNLYHKVRASLFLFVIYRYYLAEEQDVGLHGQIPFEGVEAAFERDYERSLDLYFRDGGQNAAVFSAMADSYYQLSFKYLLDQVKLSISQCSENYSLYHIKGLDDYPFRVPSELTTRDKSTGNYPVGMDAAPVRLDPSHSGWSDIFFLGMDFPEGARVVNMSVNLRVHGSNEPVRPPCECYCRYIEEPVIILKSIDLNTSKTISDLAELFNFANDYLSLLKAGVVSSGIVPPCFEKMSIPLGEILKKLLGKPGGIEIVTRVNGIPKGSRLAVSTTLLATIITRLMRFSGQIGNLTGSISDENRRVAASRAILGEWLGGSGGGWQDSGGLWPGIKTIQGMIAEHGHPEYGVSRGCLLPTHNIFRRDMISRDTEEKILNSIVLIHGGISQDVGPILEMVTEKYLLKYEREWKARQRGIKLFDEIVDALKAGDMKQLGTLTTLDWDEAIQPIIPWVNNAFTDQLLLRVRSEFKDHFWGFLMLGGMSGGGMALIINPEIKEHFKIRVGDIMKGLKDMYASSLPFIIDPVVYDFDLNHDGIVASLLTGNDAEMPLLQHNGAFRSEPPEERESVEDDIKELYGFDRRSHDHMKKLLKAGEIGLAQNRLPSSTAIEDILYEDIYHYEDEECNDELLETGIKALKNNEAAVVSFAGGMGSRWTHGAAVVKAINPFIRIKGSYRSFIEVHLSKSEKTGKLTDNRIQHVFTTSYLTHNAIADFLDNFNYFESKDRIYLSPSQSIGHRVYPMERDLRFYWEELLQQKLDDNVQKVQDDARNALIDWAKSKGEGEDYCENDPILRFNPLGHWYEIPNLIKNGTLAKMMLDNPGLNYLLCHNIDTMGAYIDPALLAHHAGSKTAITFEVTPRRIEDTGGGLAKVNGRLRLIEGLSMPNEKDEYKLSYYNTLTNWISIDKLLEYFQLDRNIVIEAAHNPVRRQEVMASLLKIEKNMSTYVTIKNVKYVWGSGQEDIYPVAQFEKLWGDMSALDDLNTSFVGVSRRRGQQLKEPALLDIWSNDGSLEYVKDKCFLLIRRLHRLSQ